MCCCVLEALLRLYPEGFQGGFECYNRLHTLYPELLKRMDDNSDDVRQVAIRVSLPYAFTPHQPMAATSRCTGPANTSLYFTPAPSSDHHSAFLATQTWAAYVSCLQVDYDRDLYKAHLEVIYRGLLVHLDDPSPGISQPMYALLCEAARPHPDLLVQMAEAVRHRQRNAELCDKLIAAAKALIA